jgi:murein DD-endopeptidase MepM/ murein hydrolase activator NlpD
VTRPQIAKVYPLPVLPDLRRPYITSGFKGRNPSRPNHDGCDLFYRWMATLDPMVKLGDGGATRDPRKPGDPKWFIPRAPHRFGDIPAIASAPGVVTLAGPTPTGIRAWVQHADGFRSGYFHLRDLYVKPGQAVTLGTPLGLPGDNPRDKDAAHLHFEVSPVDRYEPIDPEVWLEGATFYTPRAA